jgi:hypothetical protein
MESLSNETIQFYLWTFTLPNNTNRGLHELTLLARLSLPPPTATKTPSSNPHQRQQTAAAITAIAHQHHHPVISSSVKYHQKIT